MTLIKLQVNIKYMIQNIQGHFYCILSEVTIKGLKEKLKEYEEKMETNAQVRKLQMYI